MMGCDRDLRCSDRGGNCFDLIHDAQVALQVVAGEPRVGLAAEQPGVARPCPVDVRRTATLTLLVVFLGAADAAPRPRSQFTAYIDPALVKRRPLRSPSASVDFVSVDFVLDCASGSPPWLVAMRQTLARALGNRVVASIAMHVVIDCASGQDPPEFLEVESCEASHVAVTPATRGDLAIDCRCHAPATEDVAAAIQSRLRLRRH
jgi:hypothetical protein